MVIFWVLFGIAIFCFISCGIDLAFNKDFHMSENISSGMTLFSSLIFLVIACTFTSEDGTMLNGLSDGINNAFGEAIPFYGFLSNSKDGIGLLKYYENDLLGFAQELLKTIFMASVIRAINRNFPSIIVEEKLFNRVIMSVSVNLITVAIAVVLYSFFQKTTIALSILDIIIAFFSMTPIAFIICKILFGSRRDWIVLSILAGFFGKSIFDSIVYMIFIHEIALQREDLIIGYDWFMQILPFCVIIIIGIAMCIRSITK